MKTEQSELLISALWPAAEGPNWSPWAPKGSGRRCLVLPPPVGPQWKDQCYYNSLFFTSAESQCRLWQLWRGTLCDLFRTRRLWCLLTTCSQSSSEYSICCQCRVAAWRPTEDTDHKVLHVTKSSGWRSVIRFDSVRFAEYVQSRAFMAVTAFCPQLHSLQFGGPKQRAWAFFF